MNFRKLVLLIGALVVAVMTAVMAKSMLGAGSAPPTAVAANALSQAVTPNAQKILVATRPLAVGTILSADSFRYQPWPSELLSDSSSTYYVEGSGPGSSKLIGAVVRTEITAGQPITQGSLVQPGDRGFLAAALGPGMRAVTVPVSLNTGVAGFVFPGDRVDLVLTQQTSSSNGQPIKTSETIIRNLRVLAADQRTEKETRPSGGGPSGEPNQPSAPNIGRSLSSVTVEVTPKIAEKIAVAQSMGTLSLSLRSLADSSADLETAIASGEVSLPQGADAKAEKQMMLSIAAMPQDKDPTYTLDSDVSRFQRNSAANRPAAADIGGAARDGVRVLRGANSAAAPSAAPQAPQAPQASAGVPAPTAPPPPSMPPITTTPGSH